MRHTLLVVTFLLGILVAGVSGCPKEEGALERAGKAIDKAVEKTGDKIEKTEEKIKDAVEDVNK